MERQEKEQTTLRLSADLKSDMDIVCSIEQISITELIIRAIKNIVQREL